MYMAGLRQTFIDNLKYYRKERGFRQIDLALEIGKSTNYINSIENGKYFPSPETIERLSEVLGIDPMRLFDKNAPAAKDGNDRQKNFRLIERQLKDEILEKITAAFEKIEN